LLINYFFNISHLVRNNVHFMVQVLCIVFETVKIGIDPSINALNENTFLMNEAIRTT